VAAVVADNKACMHSGFGRGEWKLHEREFEAFDELSHERKVKSIDRIAGSVIISAGNPASQNEA
jgi:hypothetical protein